MLSQLFGVAVELRAARAALLQRVAGLEAAGEHTQREREAEQLEWEQRLAQLGQERDREWGARLRAAVAEEEGRSRELLAAVEQALREELRTTAQVGMGTPGGHQGFGG